MPFATTAAAHAPPHVTLTLGPARLRLVEPVVHGWRSWAAGALLVSLALHGALGGAILLAGEPPLRGGGGQAEGDEMILIADAAALDSTTPTSRTGATSAASRAETEGETPAPQRSSPTVVTQQSKPDPVTPQPDAEGQSPAVTAAPQPVAQSPVTAGGNTAATLTDTAAPPAAAAAAVGVLERYRNEVQQALVRHPPQGKLASGTAAPAVVTIEFSLSDAGHVENVQVVQSSRSAKLDRLLLAWISAARLPAPPAGLTAAERRFSFPLTIR